MAPTTPSLAPPKKDRHSKKRKCIGVSEVLAADEPPKKRKLTREARDPSPSSSLPTRTRKTAVDQIEVDVTAPQPPSKKALRLLKKGKHLPPAKPGAESSNEGTAGKSEEGGKPEAQKHSEYGIWIGNLNWSTSKDELKAFILGNSNITEDSITRMHMPGPKDGKPSKRVESKQAESARKQHNKGFAYVDFANARDVPSAVELSERLLGGRKLLIKDSKSFEGRPEKKIENSKADGGNTPNNRLFIGNLAFDDTEESIREHFAKCGAIQDVKLATFEDSGKCKGYGWIRFEDLKSAENAIRGFVMVEDEEDGDSQDLGTLGTTQGDEDLPSQKSTKMRKQWVNRIKGRTIRMEYAEDSQTRYKKRYTKEGTK